MKFGTDGVRGKAGAWPIDVSGARRVGAAAARWALVDGEAATVFVARDTRPSGAALAAAVVDGAGALDARVVDLGVLPSPGLAEVVASAGAGARGVMVTASHNPATDNGFKMLGRGGAKPTQEDTARLEAWLGETPASDAPFEAEDGAAWGRRVYHDAFLAKVGSLDALAGKCIAVDLAHGAASTSWALLQRIPGVTWVRVDAGDGVINRGVGSQHPERLAAAVLKEWCDAGIAVDGDADRVLVVDGRGRVVPGDTLAWWLTKARRVKRLAVTVMSTAALEHALPGVRVIRTPVGDKHLAAAMREDGATLGAEESGHVLFADGLAGGDGLFAGLRALASAFAWHDHVAEAWETFAPWPRRLTALRVKDRPPLDTVPAVVRAQETASRALAPGRVLLRYSGTEPVLRVFVEGPDAEVVERVSTTLTAQCAEALG